MVGKRLIFAAIGLIMTMVAIIGVWLPGVPTTFPLLVAIWAFGRSSERLGRWLERIPLLRHAFIEARRFEREKTIAWRVKLVAQASAWSSALIVGLLAHSIILSAILVLLAVICSAFMLSIPTRSTEVKPESYLTDEP